MIDKGQWWEFGQDTGVTPLLFTRSAVGFLMTTESQYKCIIHSFIILIMNTMVCSANSFTIYLLFFLLYPYSG